MDGVLIDCIKQAIACPPSCISNEDRLAIFDLLKRDYDQAIRSVTSEVSPLHLYYRALVAGVEAERLRRLAIVPQLSRRPIAEKIKDILGVVHDNDMAVNLDSDLGDGPLFGP